MPDHRILLLAAVMLSSACKYQAAELGSGQPMPDTTVLAAADWAPYLEGALRSTPAFIDSGWGHPQGVELSDLHLRREVYDPFGRLGAGYVHEAPWLASLEARGVVGSVVPTGDTLAPGRGTGDYLVALGPPRRRAGDIVEVRMMYYTRFQQCGVFCGFGQVRNVSLVGDPPAVVGTTTSMFLH